MSGCGLEIRSEDLSDCGEGKVVFGVSWFDGNHRRRRMVSNPAIA
jgi:hypothetical protein